VDEQPDPFPTIIEMHHIATFSRPKIYNAPSQAGVVPHGGNQIFMEI
jgi:hypothetical protein